ncbi:MAG: DNA methyltransferase [Pseudonocardiaceae bacterium]
MEASSPARNVLDCGDNLYRLARLPAESVDLIYLDPPFFSDRQYEVIWGDEAEIRSFEDRWEGGINVYISWMRDRVVEMYRLLKSTGSLYLHCDWHASHYLKVMLDEIFGQQNFLNNIVWCYGLGGSSSRYWPRKHDDILWYSKKRGSQYFEPPLMQASSNRMRGQMKKVVDYWDIPTINNMAKERLGYPTQKPESLLERIVESSSPKDGVVLDPFAGCGTSMVAAHRLGRQWIGIDISPTAVRLMERRMMAVGARGFDITGMPMTVEELHALKPFEFQNWVIQQFNGTHAPRRSGDMGIDGYSFFLHDPIQVKRSTRVGRNVVDNFETAIGRADKDRGYIVAFSFTRGAYEEAARAKTKAGLNISLVTIPELLSGNFDPVNAPTGPSALFDVDTVKLPMPDPRPADSRPSIQELIASTRDELSDDRDADE